ncbi:MAG: tRNA (adenosine(37)-N6)-threonylcarbamoyltransferase complex dimerization subunit type 1 TsaB [Deltaproteobacteria bacterium]|nr:tRNA (adenosine(37)-N6)-threonylcarbamoyltransferase complex dimerization subunit type 1 TsaB [Deltaproteobacteria bacterium]
MTGRALLLLALDTATRHSAVALLDGDAVLASACEPARNHSAGLLPAVDGLLRQVGLEPRDIEALACGIGPGSFTGIRIGLSTAKALAFSLDVPLVGVSSLRALAAGARARAAELSAEICPALDALKGEVFCARMRPEQLETIQPERARAPGVWAADLAGGEGLRLIVGSGALRYGEVFVSRLEDRAAIPPADDGLHRLSAVQTGLLALERLQRGERDDTASLEPLYCRPSEAELGRERKRAKAIDPG